MDNQLEILQLFDEVSSTYTYLLWDSSLEGVIIDPVLEKFERDYKLVQELGIKLRYVFETHVHADHITASDLFRKNCGSLIAVSKFSNVHCADIQTDDGQEFNFGSHQLRAIHTPGHTEGCMTIECDENLFTGDTLLVRKCGRTDFQGGSPQSLFQSVREKLFCLPDHFKVYPGHDYQGFSNSTVRIEKKLNQRLATHISMEEFVEVMNGLNLPKPKKIDEAVPRNNQCGRKN